VIDNPVHVMRVVTNARDSAIRPDPGPDVDKATAPRPLERNPAKWKPVRRKIAR
jgi:hypothetical protein